MVEFCQNYTSHDIYRTLDTSLHGIDILLLFILVDEFSVKFQNDIKEHFQTADPDARFINTKSKFKENFEELLYV